MRRFAALALSVPLLNLNVVRADVACSDHDRAAPAGHRTAGHAVEHDGEAGAAMTHGSGAHQESSEQKQSCEAPIRADCCEALSSCSPGFGANAEFTIGASVQPNDLAVAALIDIPVSRIATPDPPPPKA